MPIDRPFGDVEVSFGIVAEPRGAHAATSGTLWGMDATAGPTVPPDLDALAAALGSEGFDAVLVGGTVRDAFLGRTAGADFDIVTNASPDDLRSLAAGAHWLRSIYAVGERFGTLGLILADGSCVEASRYRESALGSDAVERRFAHDAALRDFTVNAIGLNLHTGEVLDPNAGLEDLAARILRAPGTAAERFADDPVRVLRLARFSAQLGFDADPATLLAAREHAPELEHVAVERVRDELTKLLVAEHADRGLGVALDTGALAVVLPEVAAMDGVTQPSFHDLDVFAHTVQTVTLAPATPVLRWAALLHDVGKVPARTVEPDGRIRFFRHPRIGAEIAEKICKRLKMSNAQTAAISHLVGEHMRLGDLHTGNRRAVDRAVRKLDLWERGSSAQAPIVSAEDAVELTLADLGATAGRERAPEVREKLQGVVAASRERGTGERPRHAVSGRAVMEELGLDEGPEVGAAIAAVDAAVAAGEIAAEDSAAAIEIAREAARRSSSSE